MRFIVTTAVIALPLTKWWSISAHRNLGALRTKRSTGVDQTLSFPRPQEKGKNWVWLRETIQYHTQVSICHDVALALAYLHSKGIIHRDLSTNNVLLIGAGSRAKVTDFGMSKLVDMNPQMTPLTQCPGTLAYMPPEALLTPPSYSDKLDCFSHGVLTIQVITRNFPNPGDAHKSDTRNTEHVLIQIPEIDRRKKDIDLIEPDHPLLPIALHCIKDLERERPSANQLCEQLALLKTGARYTQCVDQSNEQQDDMYQDVPVSTIVCHYR